ncbi:alkyl sulfatase dimerization domain-containing protein [Nocardioides mangrovi]|uniref:MBL fold metallo-hydrolase n=1 Tax=Nocardioides mangrovi TaxID=2874580 RepID=A0ABS7UDR8_9ACTN|nr:alkyl sulfatase dimerization domain-containing protein [Nocardioides mangrovi]MBZ5739141.1 MBL fold metallo-hydrolase [Nocardioides mangrovi]
MTSPILDLADDVWEGRVPPSDLAAFVLHDAGEVAPGVLMVPGFSHAFAIRHDDGLVLFDTGSEPLAERLHDQVRAWSDAPVTHAVYSHGHVDHVFGLARFDAEAEAEARGVARPTVIAHENVARRFDRYRRTLGYNSLINQRQFQNPDLRWPADYRYPDVTVAGSYDLEVGGVSLGLTHHRGETDDHLVGWLPQQRILFPGDLFLWVAPNAGNPQKVQRYPLEWAGALRWMASLGAELMCGSHGIPVVGAERVREALENTARYLETLVEQTLACLNEGATLVETLGRVELPEDLASMPYLQPLYDEPEFVVRNTWRQYAGWYDGNPARLKPAQDDELAREIAALCGGQDALADRAQELAGAGEWRLAGHLAQLAVDAAPGSAHAHGVRAEVYAARAEVETSTMAKGIFAWAAGESRKVVEAAQG